MESQQQGRDAASQEASPESPLRWVAPLECFASYSVAEFTKTDSNPGDDGSGTFTHS